MLRHERLSPPVRTARMKAFGIEGWNGGESFARSEAEVRARHIAKGHAGRLAA
jgi:hypothetical protein